MPAPAAYAEALGLKLLCVLMTHTLVWSGPFTLHPQGAASLFAADLAKSPGLYVWTVAAVTGRRAYYVGETSTSFAARHREHLRSYRTGSYSIHSSTRLREGSIDPVYQGFIYSRRAKATQLPIFMARRAELEAELAKVLDLVDVYAAPLVADQRTRRRLETGILDVILRCGSGLAGFEHEKWSRWPRLATELPITASLYGLPLVWLRDQFEA